MRAKQFWKNEHPAPHDLQAAGVGQSASLFKKPSQNKYQALLQDFASNLDPVAGYEDIEAPGDEIIPLEELPVDNQKIVVFDDLVCESNQNSIINYFINGRHRNYSIIYLTQTFYKVSQNIRDNCSHFCVFSFLPRENKRIADELGVDHRLLDHATDKKILFLLLQATEIGEKNFDEDI